MPSVHSAVHKPVFGYVRYSDGNAIPDNVVVTLRDLNTNITHSTTTFTTVSGIPGGYLYNIYDLDSGYGDIIEVTVSYGDCTGNNSTVVEESKNLLWCNITIAGNLPPAKPDQPNGPSNGTTGILYNFTTSTTDPDGDQIYYMYDWGNGYNSGWVGPYLSGTSCNATRIWSISGTYQIKVKAKDEHGAELGLGWSDPLEIDITQGPYINMAPTADFTYTPTNPKIKETVNFSDTSSDNDGVIINWSWDFGDGTESNQQNPSHIYTQKGEYRVNLTVTDDQNATNTKQKTLIVSIISSWDNTIEIILKYNEKNNGINYLVWKGVTLNASSLAENASLSNGESISLFNKNNGEWQIYIVGLSNISNDLLISPWDVIIIQCKSQKTIKVDISKQDDSAQSVIINFTFDSLTKKSNKGYNFFAWSKKQSISVKEFIATYGFSNQNIEISVYDTNSNTWTSYNPSLPIVFQTDFNIQLYDILCLKIAKGSDEHVLTIIEGV